eukprot:4745396-Pleurochrysis_carterae.AAC.1
MQPEIRSAAPRAGGQARDAPDGRMRALARSAWHARGCGFCDARNCDGRHMGSLLGDQLQAVLLAAVVLSVLEPLPVGGLSLPSRPSAALV